MKGIRFPEWLEPNVPLPEPFNFIHWYGVMYILVALTTWLLVRYQLKDNKNVKADDIDYLFIWGIIGALLGARLGHCIFIQPEIWLKPWRVLLPIDFTSNGVVFTGIAGMSFYGGIVGVIIAFLIFARRHKLSFLQLGDMVGAAFPLGYTFGRLGNFINQEFQGRPAPDGLPWKMYYWTDYGNGEKIYDTVAKHPSQIYEALLQGVILWLVLWFIIRPRKPWNGFIIGCYVAGYGIARFITDFFRVRNDPLKGLFPVSTTQFLDIGLVILGVVILIITKKIADKKKTTEETAKSVSK